MKVLDLFSGIGGFSLGLERAGMETVAFCERDEFCRRVLAKHWPAVPVCEDVRELKGDEYGSVDVIAGGFPCTQTSVAAAVHGKREGLQGKDSGLWFEYLRIVRTVRPLWVIVENPGGVRTYESEIQGGLGGLAIEFPDWKSRLVIAACLISEGVISTLPTATARDWRSPGDPNHPRLVGQRGLPLPEEIGSAPHPELLESLMGYPIGWTELER